jgi:hypothetical protein
MKRTSRTATIEARALTDPRPTFVSIVKGGANQRPFRAVKMDDRLGAVAAAMKEDNTMAKKTAPQIKEGYDIVTLSFSADVFNTEASVIKWLDDGGYVDYAIKKVADGFEVHSDDEFVEGTTEKVEGTVKGVTAYVGQLAGDAPAEKSDDEIVDDHAETNPSHVETVETVGKSSDVDATADTNQVDADDDTVTKSIAEMVSDFETKTKGMYEVSVLTEVLYQLRWLVDDAEYTDLEDASIEDIKKSAEGLIKSLSQAMDSTIGTLEEHFKMSLAVVANAEPAEKDDEAETGNVKPEVEPVGAEAETGGDDANAVKDDKPEWQVAIEALSKTVGNLAEQVAKGLGEVADKVDETASDLTERVEQVEASGQTRKGAGVSGDTEASDEDGEEAAKTKRSERAQRRLRSSMGLAPTTAFK